VRICFECFMSHCFHHVLLSHIHSALALSFMSELAALKMSAQVLGSMEMDDDVDHTLSHELCFVCHSRKANQLVEPCGHLCFCSGCFVTDTCPICQGPVESVSSVFFP
jgi:hypothetical protein